MLGISKNRLYTKAANNVRKQLAKVDVKAGTGLFNQRCQHNAAQSAITRGSEVYACVVIQKGYDSPIFIHFINKDGDTFKDNTLGYLSGKYDYFLVMDIEDVTRMDVELVTAKNTLFNHTANWLEKIIFSSDIF